MEEGFKVRGQRTWNKSLMCIKSKLRKCASDGYCFFCEVTFLKA